MIRAPELRPATPIERGVIDQNTFAEWGDKLDLEQYLNRERFLRGLTWPTQTLKTWVWADQENRVLSSCETFEMRSVLGGSQGVTYAIASVFTAPSLRGHRYASQMLGALVKRLLMPSASVIPHAVILYSEVGAAIYQRAGFVSRPSFEWSFVPAKAAPSVRPASIPLERATILLEIERETHATLTAPAPAPFEILPTSEQLSWHHGREDFYRIALKKPALPFAGARIGESLIAWTADWKRDCLQLLWLCARSPGDLLALIATASEAAFHLGLKTIRVHEEEKLPRAFWRELSAKGKRAPRTDSLAMIHPLTAGLSPESWEIISRSMWV